MSSTESRNRRARMLLIGLATAASAAFAAAPAGAAAGGSAKIALAQDGALAAQGVSVTYSAKAGKAGATKSAAGKQGKGGNAKPISMPVIDLALRQQGATATVGGALKLRHGKRVARLRAVLVEAGPGGATISAKLGKRRLDVFRAGGKLDVDGDSAALRNAKLSLTGAGAAKLAQRLDLEQLGAGETGRFTLNARVKGFKDKVVPPTMEPKELPTPIVDPYGAQCALPVVSKAGGDATPAAPRTELSGAPEVSEAGIEWGFRLSFREYLATIAGGHATAIAPASVLAPPPAPPQVGSFEFPADSGQYLANAPGDAGDDQLVIDGDGEIVLCAFHKGGGFRVTLANPTVTLDGDESRLTVDVATNTTGVVTPAQRVDLATIEPADADVSYAEGPRTVAWENLTTKLTQAGLDAMQLCSSGAPSCVYSAGDQLDPLTVEIVEPWGLADSCDLSAISPMPAPTVTPSWPAAPAAPTALPTLTGPETIESGAINWGIRNALRGTINGTGEFNLSGGATASHSIDPKEMSGAGKFFTWPATSGEYEAGTPGRLVLHGTGTVGLCQIHPEQAYGTVVSDPTLVLDGASSRLVLNVSTVFRSSWTSFGPIDAVSLAIGDVVVSTTPGPGDDDTITWTFPDPGADDFPGNGDDNTDSANSAVKMAAPGTSGFWLLGNFGPTSPYRTVGSGLNTLSVSIVSEGS